MSTHCSSAPTVTGQINSQLMTDIAPTSPLLSQFESLVESDYRWLYGFALRIAKNPHDAEDAVQDAFLAAYQHLSGLKSSQKLKTWIVSIVLNCARMQYRTKNRFPVSIDSAIDSEGDASYFNVIRDDRPSPEECYSALELYTKVNDLVAALPLSLRETFLLRRVHGLNTAETAKQLGVTKSCVKSRLLRASAWLNQAILRRFSGVPRQFARKTRSTLPDRECVTTVRKPRHSAQLVADHFEKCNHLPETETWSEGSSGQQQ